MQKDDNSTFKNNEDRWGIMPLIKVFVKCKTEPPSCFCCKTDILLVFSFLQNRGNIYLHVTQFRTQRYYVCGKTAFFHGKSGRRVTCTQRVIHCLGLCFCCEKKHKTCGMWQVLLTEERLWNVTGLTYGGTTVKCDRSYLRRNDCGMWQVLLTEERLWNVTGLTYGGMTVECDRSYLRRNDCEMWQDLLPRGTTVECDRSYLRRNDKCKQNCG
jgi:hypothetical protein